MVGEPGDLSQQARNKRTIAARRGGVAGLASADSTALALPRWLYHAVSVGKLCVPGMCVPGSGRAMMRYSVILACGLSAVCLPICAAEIPPEPGATQPGPPLNILRTWIQSLDADRFEVREAATGRLIAAGRPAIRPLVVSLEDASLEAATRTVLVLRELSMSADLDTAFTAEAALEQIAGSFQASADRARATLRLLASVRQERALDALREAGARIHRENVQYGPLGIEFSERWHGKLKDLQHLRWVSNVTTVNLSGERFGDRFLKALSRLENVERLVLQGTAVTDVGMVNVEKLTGLRWLIVFHTAITDAAVKHLLALPRLDEIKFYGTQVTAAGVAELKESLGDRGTVDRRAGGFLGVALSGPCQVSRVVPQSAADKADLRQDDIVLKFADRYVSTVQDLIGKIGSNRLGGRIQFEVLRGYEPVQLTVERKGETLGIEGESRGVGIFVTKVDEDSAAAVAGIRQGDRIYTWNRDSVHQLPELEKRYEAAAQAEVVVIRGGQTLPKEVILGGWKWPDLN